MGYSNTETEYKELFAKIESARIDIEEHRKSIAEMMTQLKLYIVSLEKTIDDSKDLDKITDNFEVSNIVGQGGGIELDTPSGPSAVVELDAFSGPSEVVELDMPSGPSVVVEPEIVVTSGGAGRSFGKNKARKDDEDNKPKKKIKTKGSNENEDMNYWQSSIGATDTEQHFKNETLARVRVKKSSPKKKTTEIVKAEKITFAIINTENITIKDLSEKIGKPSNDIIKQLLLLEMPKTINETIDFETAAVVAGELGVRLELDIPKTVEEMVLEYHDTEQDDPKDLVVRPPIVTIMGHVDHGKTSILDFIRKTSVTKGEAGGITQHIGAYSIKFNNQKITFVDTPGHAAFTDMRARGANLTDIVIIVVAADDGVMPQTIEAINHSKAANASIIVAINKIDKGLGNIDRIYTQLSELSLLPEDWGGDTPIVKVSARTGEGINDLLETILVLAEIKELRANPKRKAQGIVVEARLDKGMGPVATVIIQNGTLSVGSYVVAGVTSGRIRGMYNDLGERIRVAGPSTAVSIQGLQDVPLAGDILLSTEDEKTMRQVVQERLNKEKTQKITSSKISLEDLYKEIEEGKLKNLNLIIKTDVQGSAEALKESLIDLSDSEVKVNSIHAMAGAINESDVMLAETTNSIIIGFNVRPDAKAKALAEQKNIEIKIYRVIYDAIDDISKAIKGLSAPKFREEYLGSAEVRVVYTITGVGLIAGCIVKDGKIVRNARVRLIRDNIVVAETSITSLKRVKDDVKEVAAGIECGIGLDKIESLEKGDIIESFLVKSNK
ncbi:MAG: translation initiation factor IF-2 [Christensenellales bacterium]|jgi:translation initiation factor IF-2|nr:translation initiation factor IF-2 [Clostridiales bacterium]